MDFVSEMDFEFRLQFIREFQHLTSRFHVYRVDFVDFDI